MPHVRGQALRDSEGVGAACRGWAALAVCSLCGPGALRRKPAESRARLQACLASGRNSPPEAPPTVHSSRRCQQDGRIIGGIGSVPGFGWWPIKAYRECPEAIKRGFEYRRCGAASSCCSARLLLPGPCCSVLGRGGMLSPVFLADAKTLLQTPSCSRMLAYAARRKGQITDEVLFGRGPR